MRSSIPLLLLLTACSSEETDLGLKPASDGGVVADSGDMNDAGENPDAGGVDATPDGGSTPPDAGLIDPVAEPYRTLKSEGPPENRIDIVIVGDGYTREELHDVYADHADRLVEQMFERRSGNRDVTQPFRQLSSYFNVHRVHLASNESGIDDPTGSVQRDTALDGTLACTSATNCHVDYAKVDDAIANALSGSGIVPDWRVVVLNTEEKLGAAVTSTVGRLAIYGGGYGGAGNKHFAREVALRELAVAFCNVGYEFGGTGFGDYGGPEPVEHNLTKSSTGAKWERWLGYDEQDDGLGAIGAFEGGGGYHRGIYRPLEDSKMGELSNTQTTYRFGAVVREAIILTIYQAVQLVEIVTPDTSQTVVDPPTLSFTMASYTRLDVRWTVDGQEVDQLTDPTFGFTAWADFSSLPAGTYTVTAHISDDTSWVRVTPRTGLEDTVTWTVERTP